MFDFCDKEIVMKKLQELLDKEIPRMSLEKLLDVGEYKYLKSYTEKATQEEISECNRHLSLYCECGYNENRDIFSDEECLFYWGLKHGEMVTNDNGLCRTYYHYLTLDGERHKVELLLQYHPSCYSIG